MKQFSVDADPSRSGGALNESLAVSYDSLETTITRPDATNVLTSTTTAWNATTNPLVTSDELRAREGFNTNLSENHDVMVKNLMDPSDGLDLAAGAVMSSYHPDDDITAVENLDLVAQQAQASFSLASNARLLGYTRILGRLSKADGFITQQLAYFLSKLAEYQENGESLLDRTMVLCGSGMSYGHSHANSNLPILLAGGKALGLKHGQHLDYNQPVLKKPYTLDYEEWKNLCGPPRDTKARLSNVLLTMLQKMDVKETQFVDSLGPVPELVG